MRRGRVNSALYFDMSQGDDMEVTQTTESGVQANTQTSSSGVQTERPRKTFEAGTQSELRVNTKGTQATEGKSEEIEKIKTSQ